MMMRGFSAFSTSYPKPISSIVPGRKFCTSTSETLIELAQRRLRFLLAQVHAHALLAAVVLDPVGALLAHPWRVIAGFLAADALDLDDFRPEAGEHLRAARSCLMATQIDHADTVQWALAVCHGGHSIVRTFFPASRWRSEYKRGRGRESLPHAVGAFGAPAVRDAVREHEPGLASGAAGGDAQLHLRLERFRERRRPLQPLIRDLYGHQPGHRRAPLVVRRRRVNRG